MVGGGVASSGDLLLAAIREAIYRRSLPLANRDLQIAYSPLGLQAGMAGASFMVSDELFSRQRLGRWISRGSPIGVPEMSASGLIVAPGLGFSGLFGVSQSGLQICRPFEAETGILQRELGSYKHCRVSFSMSSPGAAIKGVSRDVTARSSQTRVLFSTSPN
jgi:hypothetical protein